MNLDQTMDTIYLQAGINLFVCFAIIGICVCRLNHIPPRLRFQVGTQYVVLLMAAGALAFAPYLWEFPGWTTVIFGAAVLFMLVMDKPQWGHRDAPNTKTVKPEGFLTGLCKCSEDVMKVPHL